MKNMFKKFVVLLASLGLIVQLSGCTSKDSKDDGEAIAIDGTETADSAEVEKVEGEQNLDIAADDSAASLSADSLPEDALGESTASSTPAADPGAPPPDVAIADPSVDALPPDTLGTESPSVAEATPPPIEEPVMTESSSSSSSSVASSEAPKEEKKPLPSYRKVDQTPWKEGGKLLNAVYVARSGDTWSSVNKSIYGNEKTSALKKMNPAIKSRGLKVGEKVYYNSPNRPDDSTKVLTYYEDTGLAPEVYIAKSGDDLKTVAKNLLGSKENWKELYATNDFESKGALDEGTQIKYWKSAPAPKNVAANTATPEMAAPAPVDAAPPTPPMDPSMPPDPNAMAQTPPPPTDPNMHTGDMAPPPPPPGGDQMAMNHDLNAPPPPPPPPPPEMAPPPPPPPAPGAPAKMAGAEEAANPMEDDQMTTLAAGAVLAVGLALFMIMRRRRKKELEQAIQDTHVG
jgi:hypothetical protein